MLCQPILKADTSSASRDLFEGLSGKGPPDNRGGFCVFTEIFCLKSLAFILSRSVEGEDAIEGPLPQLPARGCLYRSRQIRFAMFYQPIFPAVVISMHVFCGRSLEGSG